MRALFSLEMTSKKSNSWTPYLLFGTTLVVTFVLAVVLIVQIRELNAFKRELSFVSSLSENSQQVYDDMSVARDYLTQYGSDLNDIRSYLLLPTSDYDFSRLGERQELVPEEDLSVQLFSFVESLGSFEENSQRFAENQAGITAFWGDERFVNTGLQVNTQEREGDVLYQIIDPNHFNVQVMELSLAYDGSFNMDTWKGPSKIKLSDNFFELQEKLVDFLDTPLKTFREEIIPIQNKKNDLLILLSADSSVKEKGLSWQESESLHSYVVTLMRESTAVASIVLPKKEKELLFDDEAMSLEELPQVLASLDVRNAQEKLVAERKAELDALVEDRGFKKVLTDNGLQFGVLTELDGRALYPLINESGELVRTIFIDLSTGDVGIELPSGEAQNLATAIESLSVKKKILELPKDLSSYDRIVDAPAQLNLLIGGKHGSNVDTIMFANVNVDKRKVSLISIPRDLWHDERKINSVYADFGMNEMKNRLEDIMGRRIHHYILIDMYVFRDIIDQIDGVTVTLEEDLVDPTYKTCEGEVCSTLYYEAGEHHLDGKEALRIARSRYTTSDYSRAARQQLILEGIQKKASAFGFGDAGRVVKLIDTVLAATETDITPEEALLYYFRYQNFDINRGNVVSTANVLEAYPHPVPYVTSHVLSSCGEEDPPDCKTQYAIDTLVPRDKDWNTIRWYVSSVLGT